MKKFISIDPTVVKNHCDHVRILFSDGEVSSTKGGDCWGMRNLHCFSLAICDITQVPQELTNLFDKEYNGYPCAYLYDTYENENAICEEYRDLLTSKL